ncbi:MAG: response regulator [Clostridia bacterium]|nr:response regulator [Clostridia bacterium]
MKFLEYMGIRTRLMLIFAIWMVGFACFGMFTISQLNSLGNITRDIYSKPLKVSNAAIEARVDVIKIQRAMKDIMLADNRDEITKQINDINVMEQEVLNSFKTIEENVSDSGSVNRVVELRKIFGQWKESRKEIINLVESGSVKEAVPISQVKNAAFVQQIEIEMDKVDSFAKSSADDLVAKANDIEESEKWAILTLMALLGGAGLLLFLISIRSIIKPITVLENAMSSSTGTGGLIEANLQGNNEIVEMAKHYNSLVNKLKDQFWLKDGQNLLSQEIAGSNSLSELTSKSINFLSRAIGAGNGVFYVYDEQERLLHLNASFAFTERDKLSNRYALGEGIVGQVALERKAILLKNVGRQEALITTGIINESPLNTYAFPLAYEGELYGVIELSSFEPINQLKRDFLNEVGKIIVINLKTTMQNQKIKDLLKVTEEARKEARGMADELQKANEILEEQSSILQQQTEELQQTNAQLEEQQQLLQQQSEELQQTNSQLEEQQQRMEEQSRLLNIQNRELENSKSELLRRSGDLETSNRYKSEFLANISHELRTPLNSIILLSKLLAKNEKNDLDPNVLEKISVIHRSGQELLRLINDILDLSKIEAGRMELNISPFHTGELVQQLNLMFEGVAKEKGIEFTIEDYIRTRMVGDKDRISQILRNFLSNALKFTEKGSVILKIRPGRENENSIVFAVTDTGIGIPRDKFDIIFEEFQQGDGSISRKYGGTGLGLSISRRLAELMGGEIRVESKEGVGSSFSLHLRNTAMPNNTNKGARLGADLIAATSLNTDIAPKFDRVILIIEDDETFAKYIKKLNEGMGFDTLIASSGKEGLRLARKHRIDGILLDLGLPDMSGIEVLRELKSTVELRSIPVHILSSRDKDNKLQGMGAIGYHQKPVDEDEITKLITNMIAFSDKKPKQLLIIEDNAAHREAIKELIGSSEVKVKGVETEDAAKLELEKGIYDAVILDLELKQGDGFGICRFIGEKGIDIPVIIYTAKELAVDQEKEIKRYADSVIIKTANSDERLLDEVTLFLHEVRTNEKDRHYMLPRTNKEYSLSLKGKKILIVDDDPRNIFVLAAALENHGADIIEAENGKAALEKLNEQKADLVLMDIMMPVMDGYEAIRAIRNKAEISDIPIIALTAKTLKGDREKCIEAGANDYISKPVDYDVLIRLVKAWINK